MQRARAPRDGQPRRLRQFDGARVQYFEQALPAPDHQFRGGRRRRSAQIRHEIGNRKIRLMPDCGDHRYRAGRNRARDRFLVESPQVFERSASARNNHHFRPSRPAEICEARHHLLRRAVSLHLRRVNTHVAPREPAFQNLENVANHRSGRRRHDPDPLGQRRKRPFPGALEQPFGCQFLLQLLESQLQRAVPLRLDRFHDELHFAARIVHIDAPARQHRDAILRLELQISRGHLITDRLQLRRFVLQREIVVPARRDARS